MLATAHINVRALGDEIDGPLIEGTDHPCRGANDQRIVRKAFALGDQRASSDQAVMSNPRTIEHNGAHAYQRIVADRAPVQHDVVADESVGADGQRKAGIGMQRAVILHVRPLTDLDPLIVAAQHGAVPNADFGLQPYPPNQHGGIGDLAAVIARKLRRLAIERVDRHSRLLDGRNCTNAGREKEALYASSPQASSAITTARPDIKLQKPAISVARNTNSKRRPSCRRASSVLRMIRNGADSISSGTAAIAAARGPVLSSPKLGSRSVA